MKPLRFILVPLLLFFLACHQESQVSESGIQPDSSVPLLEQEMEVSAAQFEQSGMELGALGEYLASDVVTANGYIDVPPENRSRISTFLGGYVSGAELLPGDKVNKGQVLLTLESTEYLKLQQSFLESKEKLAYLKSLYEAQSTLSEENVSSRRNYLQAKTEYESILAIYESLAKQLQLIPIDPSEVRADNLQTSIRLLSPLDGYITRMNAVNGMYVNASDEICEVINIGHLHIELKAFEKDLPKLSKGQILEFWLPDNKSTVYRGEIILIGKTVEGDERTIPVHAHIHDKQAQGLIPGMYVEAHIKTHERKVKGLPVESLYDENDKQFVLVRKTVDEGRYIFEKRQVVVGLVTEEWFEVKNSDSLEREGKEILIKGGFNLF